MAYDEHKSGVSNLTSFEIRGMAQRELVAQYLL